MGGEAAVVLGDEHILGHVGSVIRFSRTWRARCHLQHHTTLGRTRRFQRPMPDSASSRCALASQDMILEVPIESWPVVDVLIAFYSNGFPLKKAEGYVKLRDPFCFNAIGPQSLLLDRRKIYAKLVAIGVPVPKHVVFDHTDPTTTGKLVQHEDYIEVSEVRINKPFVEKPADAERHDINIYYPDSVGGGTKRLFRKEKNESSAFYPDESAIRTDGAYVYEEYLPTEGTDLKVRAGDLSVDCDRSALERPWWPLKFVATSCG